MNTIARKITKQKSEPMRRLGALVLIFVFLSVAGFAQADSNNSNRNDPDEIRGYKVAHASVAVKRQSDKASGYQASGADDSDAMVQVGDPRLVSVRPFGVTFEVPITIAALDKGGTVDFLSFEDIKVNGSSVSIEDFQQKFDIPNKSSMELPSPVKVYISTPIAMLGALNEWRNSKPTWPLSGRVYVFGHFKKFIFKVKRVVPIDFNLSIANPLHSAPSDKDDAKPISPAVKTN